MFTSPWQIWVAVAGLPMLGFGLGYLLAWALHLHHVQCRTVSLETGMQNMAVAFTLILLTFADSPLLHDMLVMPSLLLPIMVLDCLLIVALYRAWMKWRPGPREETASTLTNNQFSMSDFQQPNDDQDRQ
ncbi:ileal sodium/bile acid cotransporter-like [Acanthaster planci]|uniref:Ileal sodium/bile acid cotransporter-like n=1 Tax=Acanthaster planci TaxID=133434 RepID=A0A8B7YZY5_ACAPL|nr:ileal sodium/bile acid cotransporter-like [Acanthaster planci]